MSDSNFSCELTVSNIDDVNYEIAYQILLRDFDEDLTALKGNNKVIRLKRIKKLILDLNNSFSLLLCTRSEIVKELYILHILAKSLDRYNDEKLKLGNIQYRHAIYFPNLLYILIRLTPNAKKIIQQTIRKVYQEFCNKAPGLVNLHVNSFYLDQDSIKSDVLRDFIGNGLKKFNPLNIGNVNSFYKSCFRSIFEYYFRRRRDLDNQNVVSFEYFDTSNLQSQTTSGRLSIYRDVLYEFYLEQTQKKHTVLGQLSYNFQIFRNVIIPNEFQNIYQNSKNSESNNNEYKLIDFFDDDIFSNNLNLLLEIRKLPIIYKLLRCVHVQTQNSIPYNEFIIKQDSVKFVILEELSSSFKNMFIDSYVKEILEQIAKNFIKNILTGEYINLITFSTVRINSISFLDQLRKFIRICLSFNKGDVNAC